MQPCGLELIDRTLGGLAPGLPLVVEGASGTGRSVLALSAAGSALRQGQTVTFLTSEPPDLLLRQAADLGFDLERSLRDETLILLESDECAAANLRTLGSDAFIAALRLAAGTSQVLVLDPLSIYCAELVDDSPLRSLVRDLFAEFSDSNILATVDADLLEIVPGLRRVLLDCCGAYVKLERDDSGLRRFCVEKTRTASPAIRCQFFEIGEAGALLTSAPPASPESQTTDSGPEPEPAAVAKPSIPSILIVEDDDDIVALYRRWLGNAYQVTFVEDGGEALARLLAERPDLIILDLGMPRISGYDVLRALRKAPWLPVLVVSARMDRPRDRVRPILLGGSDTLAKPFKRVELLQKVDTLLRLPAPPAGQLDVSSLMGPEGREADRRVLAADEFQFRAQRAKELAQRMGFEWSVVAVESSDAENLDRLATAGVENLRLEDGFYLVSDSRALILLAGAAGSNVARALNRLTEFFNQLGGNPETLSCAEVDFDGQSDPESWAMLFKDLQDWTRSLTP